MSAHHITWYRYVNDVLTVVKKGTQDTLQNHLNSMDPHMTFAVEHLNEQGAIPFLDTFPNYHISL